MGIRERKERERAKRKNAILNCAKALIVDKGVDTISLSDIAKKAELSKATLYLYFPNKEAILKALFETWGVEFITYLKAQIPEHANGLQAVNALWNGYLTAFNKTKEASALFGIRNNLAPSFPLVIDESESARNTFEYQLYELVKGFIEGGQKDGSFDPSLDAGATARSILLVVLAVFDNVARIASKKIDSFYLSNELKNVCELLYRSILCDGVDKSTIAFAPPKKSS